jgi:hypothetical protein
MIAAGFPSHALNGIIVFGRHDSTASASRTRFSNSTALADGFRPVVFVETWNAVKFKDAEHRPRRQEFRGCA